MIMERLIPVDINTLQTFSANPLSINTQDISWQIAIASYPETPRSLLEVLANSSEPEVAEAAQLHVNYRTHLRSFGRSRRIKAE